MTKPEQFEKMLKDAQNDRDRLKAYEWYLVQWIERSKTIECFLDDTERRFDMDDYLREEGWVEE